SAGLQTAYKYSPYGARTTTTATTSANALGFAGMAHDPTGLVHMRARYYSPSLGRFISEDPIGLDGGVNPYAYVDSSPLNGTDPMGLAACPGPVREAADVLGYAWIIEGLNHYWHGRLDEGN